MADPVGHVGHDPIRVAEAVDRGARLALVVRFCTRCADLYADLAALTAALPMAAIPARPRDFALSIADARRLRTVGWRSWWSALASTRDAVTRPLAVTFTTLGLTGILLTAAPTLLPMAAGTGASSAHAVIELGTGVRSTAEPDDPGRVAAGAELAPNGEGDTSVRSDRTSTLVVSALLLATGGAILLVRRVAVQTRRMP